ncbi:uncharacterized protein LY89DRAFT_268719 [Mollisia scopiformis]|uniref:Uncharacterized protein n=1 Tax=Mollisia scopiformis TaxID=149040 RepID=A0A132BCA6_MOLSC|nr:uncharacterized protein LY89DRAFT_268719 [Mollisia scopiformis]KUJ10060.1 hypothetical protein LY89DRAFT_268719 [Mollisia scopiformis]
MLFTSLDVASLIFSRAYCFASSFLPGLSTRQTCAAILLNQSRKPIAGDLRYTMEVFSSFLGEIGQGTPCFDQSQIIPTITTSTKTVLTLEASVHNTS